MEKTVLFGILAALFAGAGSAFAQAPAPGSPIPAGGKIRPTVPVMRSLEYTYNRVSTDPGRYRAAGYRGWIAGLTPAEMFASPGGLLAPLLGLLGAANETTARFTHTEAGCLQETIPKTPNLAGVLSLKLTEPTMTMTHARARQCIYYTETPTNRSWIQPKSFATGKLAAVLHLVDETDFVDLLSRTGVGTATIEVACANDLRLVTGRTFNFGSLASSYVADFQFQIQPKPPAIDPDFTEFPVVFADSGVWRVLEQAPVPACNTWADVCATPIQKCP